MNTPSDLLIMEAGGGYEIFDQEEFFEAPGLDQDQSEDIVIISGKITVFP